MRVLYDYQIFSEQKFGGISRYIYFLFKYIKEINVKTQVGVLISDNEYIHAENNVPNSFSNIKFPKKRSILKFINKNYTKYLLRSGKYDILHASYYEDYYFKKYPIVTVVTVYDLIHEKFYNSYLALQDDNFIKKKRNALQNADMIIAISETTRKDVLEIYPFIKPEKIRTVHLGLMLQNNYQIRTNKVQNSRPYCLFVGSRIMYKNFNLLIKAVSLIADPSFDIICAGGGSFTPEEITSITNSKVRRYFFQKNIIDDSSLNELYQNATCYVSTSEYEGFGLPILEAFNNACPVILSDNPCYKEIANEGADYFSLKLPQQLADLLNKVSTDSNYREKLKRRGIDRLKFFDKDKLLKETLDCYAYALESTVKL